MRLLPELIRNAITYPTDDDTPISTPNGTLAHITGIFGLTLASLVIRSATTQPAPDHPLES